MNSNSIAARAEYFSKAILVKHIFKQHCLGTVKQADKSVKKEIKDLIAGNTIEKPAYEDITYGDIQSSQDNLRNFLFFTGYLKKVKERQEDRHYLSMKIPYEEVAGIYENTVLSWFNQKLKTIDFSNATCLGKRGLQSTGRLYFPTACRHN